MKTNFCTISLIELERRSQIARSEQLMGRSGGQIKTYLGEAVVKSTDPRIRLPALASQLHCLLCDLRVKRDLTSLFLSLHIYKI